MDDNLKKMVRYAVLLDTERERSKLLDFWLGFDNPPSEGEEKQLDDEMDALRKRAEKSASLAMLVLDEADTRAEFISALSSAQDRGFFDPVDGEEEDDEDDDGFDYP